MPGTGTAEQPLLVWGIVERPETIQGQGLAVFASADRLAAPPGEDAWVFSTAEEIPAVLRATGIVRGDSRKEEETLLAAS